MTVTYSSHTMAFEGRKKSIGNVVVTCVKIWWNLLSALSAGYFALDILAQSFLIALWQSDFPSSKRVSMSVSADEVAKHNTDKDCWVIVGDQVLDVTNFLSDLAEQSGAELLFNMILSPKAYSAHRRSIKILLMTHECWWHKILVPHFHCIHIVALSQSVRWLFRTRVDHCWPLDCRRLQNDGNTFSDSFRCWY